MKTTFKIIYRVHSLERMFERRISAKKIHELVESGEVIEDYSSEGPDPSRLLLGRQGNRPIHLVVSENLSAQEVTVITVYAPDPERWKPGFRSRRV